MQIAVNMLRNNGYFNSNMLVVLKVGEKCTHPHFSYWPCNNDNITRAKASFLSQTRLVFTQFVKIKIEKNMQHMKKPIPQGD